MPRAGKRGEPEGRGGREAEREKGGAARRERVVAARTVIKGKRGESAGALRVNWKPGNDY
jgi:hypothetical protein